MKKLIILPILLLMILTVFHISPVNATSSGYERHTDDKSRFTLNTFQ